MAQTLSLVIKDLLEIGNIDNRDAVYIYPEGILPSINLMKFKITPRCLRIIFRIIIKL